MRHVHELFRNAAMSSLSQMRKNSSAVALLIHEAAAFIAQRTYGYVTRMVLRPPQEPLR